MTKLHKIKRSVIIGALIFSLAITATFIACMGSVATLNSLPTSRDEATTIPTAPTMPTTCDYEYRITGSGNSLTAERMGSAGNQISANSTVADLCSALNAQNSAKVTKLTFGTGSAIDIGARTFTVSSGTYILEGKLEGNPSSGGLVQASSSVNAYMNGEFDNYHLSSDERDGNTIVVSGTATIIGGKVTGGFAVSLSGNGKLNICGGSFSATRNVVYLGSGSLNMFDGNVTTTSTKYHVISMAGSGVFNMYGGKISTTDASIYPVSSLKSPNIEINVYGGTLSSSGSMGTVISTDGGVVNVYGGTIEQTGLNTARAIDTTVGTVNVYGGTVRATSTRGGRAINISTTGKANIYGGLLEAPGNAIHLEAAGTLNVEGGTIRSTGASFFLNLGNAITLGGNAIYTHANGTVNIKGGTIENTGGGAAIYANGGTTTLRQDEGKAILVTSNGTSVTFGAAPSETTYILGTIVLGNQSATLKIYSGSIQNTVADANVIYNNVDAALCLGITWSGHDNLMYDRNPKDISASFGGVIGTETFTVTSSIEGGSATAVGSYTATATVTGATVSKYTIIDGILNFEITKRPITVVWFGLDREDLYFSGAPKNVYAEISPTETMILDGDSLSVITEGGDEINVGTYYATATLTGTGSESYEITNAVMEYVIAYQPVTFIWGASDFTYDGDEKVVSYSTNDLSQATEITIRAENNKNTEAGTYTAEIIIEGANAFKYEITNPTLEYEIKPKTLESAWINCDDLIYDNKAKVVDITIIGGVINNATVHDEVQATVDGGDAVLAGTHTATATLDNSNYTLGSNGTIEYVIAAIELGVTWSNSGTRTYDKNASNVTAQLNTSNVLIGDTVDITVSDNTETDAGTYLALAALNNPNYTLGSNATCEYIIQAITVSVSWNNSSSRVYNGSASNVTATAGGVLSGDTLNFAIANGDKKVVGNHTATITGFTQQTTNYVLPQTGLTQDYTITKLLVELAWTNNTNLIYSGAAQNVTAVVANAATGDKVTITVDNGDRTDAGNYTATALSLSGADATNYELPSTGLETDYTIAKKEVGISWNGQGTRAYDGIQSNVTATLSVIGNDVVNPTMENNRQKVAGTHVAKITALTGSGAKNYCLPSVVTQEYTILQREVELAWNGYAGDAKSKTVTATVANIVEGDDVTVTVSGGTASSVGNYTATATALTGASAANYQLPSGGLTQAYSISLNANSGSAPSVELESKTATSITIKAVSGAEYSKDGQTWQDTNTFNNLTAETAYTIYCRIKATDTTDSSAIGQANITTDSVKKGGCNSIALDNNIWWLTLITTFTVLCAAMLIFKKKPIKN